MTNEEFIKSISLPNEEWRDVVGYEDFYMVSNQGRVISLCREVRRFNTIVNKPTQILSTSAKEGNYKKVSFYVNGTHKTIDVHRLVALAFIPNPNNYPCIDHIDGNKHNNNVSNLKWCNDLQNSNNPITRKKHRDLLISKSSRFAPVKVVAIKDDGSVAVYDTICEATKHGYSQSMISECCNGKRKHHGGMRWLRYSDYETLINMSKNS